MKSAHPELQLDDQSLRIIQWRLPPGSEIGWHRHAFDYVVVPITDGRLTVADASSRNDYEIHAGQSYARKAGVEHNVLNETDVEIRFVEIEIKGGTRS